ncbi:uncharacterized protein B0T23DRAFT_191209 [Neurospora hispaniola]|uniref:Uncharacterized protein n=1 Tax=Neurospora hispaniola TaxID=588809 RepID=A0AAJ0I3T8_9PEZI|nr:hypothetical protein B0T23DRAFT_191209 [Neurospora hispaniola]
MRVDSADRPATNEARCLPLNWPANVTHGAKRDPLKMRRTGSLAHTLRGLERRHQPQDCVIAWNLWKARAGRGGNAEAPHATSASHPGQSRVRSSGDCLALTGRRPTDVPDLPNLKGFPSFSTLSRSPGSSFPSGAPFSFNTCGHPRYRSGTYLYSIVDTPSITYLLDPIVFQSPAIIRHDNRTRDILTTGSCSPKPKPTA